MKTGTYDLIRTVQPHILTLQEVRRQLTNTPRYNFVCRVRGNQCNGGGE